WKMLVSLGSVLTFIKYCFENKKLDIKQNDKTLTITFPYETSFQNAQMSFIFNDIEIFGTAQAVSIKDLRVKMIESEKRYKALQKELVTKTEMAELVDKLKDLERKPR